MIRGLSYQAEKTILHGIHPLSKTAFLVFFLVASLSQKRWYDPLMLIIILMIISLVTRSAMVSHLVRSRLLIMTGFFIIFVQVIIRTNGNLLFYLVPESVPVIGGIIPVTDYGLMVGLNLYGRFVAIIASSFLFVRTTDPYEFAVAFQQLKIPYRYSYALILALRSVLLFDFEFSQVINALSVRGVEFQDSKLSLTRMMRILRYTFIPLIVSTINRSTNLAISMQTRGFGAYRTRTFYKPKKFKITDLLVILAGIILAGMIYLQ